MTGKKIIFVCTGNTCRSAMAEALAKNIVRQWNYGKNDIEITSAGITALPGSPASEHAQNILKYMDIDISGHRASLLTREEICSADLVLTMTGAHCRQVKEMAPECSDRVFTLAEYAGCGNDIPDPFGASEDTYRLCASEISVLAKRALSRFLSGRTEESSCSGEGEEAEEN